MTSRSDGVLLYEPIGSRACGWLQDVSGLVGPLEQIFDPCHQIIRGVTFDSLVSWWIH